MVVGRTRERLLNFSDVLDLWSDQIINDVDVGDAQVCEHRGLVDERHETSWSKRHCGFGSRISMHHRGMN